MKNDIFLVTPPKTYEDGLVTYHEGMDTVPELIEYINHGFSMEDAKKMELLMRIEAAKHHLELIKDDAKVTESDLLEAKEYIESLIETYNKL